MVGCTDAFNVLGENRCMGQIRFGPAGIPLGCEGSTADGVEYCKKIGLLAMEVEFVRGVKMGREKALEVGKKAKGLGVKLSCHCPYWINCCAKEKDKLDASVRNILETARAAYALGASPIVFHTGFYMGRSSEKCRPLVLQTLQKTLDAMEEEGIRGVVLGAELTGKHSAYGNLDEIIDLAAHFGLQKCQPVVDYGHYHARMGRLRKKEDFEKILCAIENGLGSAAAKNFHCHFSEISYSDAGELMHLELGKDEPPFEPLAKAFVEHGWEGTVICETPMLEVDALKLQKAYAAASGKN